jgi:hypothetical protein
MAPGEVRKRRDRKAKNKGGMKKDEDKQVTKKGRGPGGKNNGPKGGKPEPKTGKKQRQQAKQQKRVKGDTKAKGKGKPEKKKPVTAEELDASMDEYWMKSKDKTLASKKLDDDMDSYWAKKGEGGEGEEGENKEGEAAAEDSKPEAKETES